MSETVTFTNPNGQSITFGDASQPNIIYRGVSGIGLTTVQNYSVDTAYQPGARFVRSKKNAVPLKLSLTLIGQGQGPAMRLSLLNTISFLGQIFNPSISQTGVLQKVGADGITRQLNSVQYGGGLEVSDQALNWAYIPVELLLEGYDPTWYSPSLHSQTIGASTDPFGFSVPILVPLVVNGQAQGTSIIVNAGNIVSQPVFTFNGPLQNFSITNQANGQQFFITQVLNGGDTMVVDTLNGVITYTPSGGTGIPLYSSFAGNKQWVGLNPGNNTITFLRDVAGNQQCTITWNDTWNYA